MSVTCRNRLTGLELPECISYPGFSVAYARTKWQAVVEHRDYGNEDIRALETEPEPDNNYYGADQSRAPECKP